MKGTLLSSPVSAAYWWREENPFLFWRFSLLPFQSYWIWYDGKYDFYPMSYDNLGSVSQNVLKFYQNILRNTTQVIIRHRVKILFSVISSSITLERQKRKSSKKERDPPLFTSKQLIKFKKILSEVFLHRRSQRQTGNWYLNLYIKKKYYNSRITQNGTIVFIPLLSSPVNSW
jgi:hypothetical protein